MFNLIILLCFAATLINIVLFENDSAEHEEENAQSLLYFIIVRGKNKDEDKKDSGETRIPVAFSS